MNIVEEQAFRNIGSALSGITGNTASGAFVTGGGSFSYTPDQMRSIITKLTNLARGYRSSMRNAAIMASVEGPGLEPASQSQASVASSSGRAYQQSIENELRYCWALAQKFQDTLDDYLGLERRNVMEINQAGPRDEQAGPRAGI